MSQTGDRAMEELITAMLSRDSRVDLHEIQVRVQGGVVYLTGAVDSAAERRAIEEDVRAVGREVVTDLVLRNYVERTDEELSEEVKRALMRDIEVNAGPIKVSAKDSVVTLSGNVASHAQKNVAETVAWWTPGVTDVINDLVVEDEPESYTE